jgi:hypothetical protein
VKLLFRYFVAIILIPIGGILGGLGLIQNFLRKKQYDRLYRQIMDGLPESVSNQHRIE